MISWPQTLVREIARRRCVFFLGAGVSASAVDVDGNRPRAWGSFLQAACDELVQDDLCREEIRGIIEERRYLLALEAIATESDKSDYQDFLESNFNNQAFEPSDLHKVILGLDSRIVITTNFDKIYERLCLGESQEGYKVVPYDSDSLGDALRSDIRLIIKAHGSIDDVQKMVFTKAEYHEAKKKYPQFYDALKAIFLTNTCVFIGYSLDDPDVLLVMEEIRLTTTVRRPHYALMLKGQATKYALSDWESSYNIRVLEYEPDHETLIGDLRDLWQRVEELRETNQQA